MQINLTHTLEHISQNKPSYNIEIQVDILEEYHASGSVLFADHNNLNYLLMFYIKFQEDFSRKSTQKRIHMTVYTIDY